MYYYIESEVGILSVHLYSDGYGPRSVVEVLGTEMFHVQG